MTSSFFRVVYILGEFFFGLIFINTPRSENSHNDLRKLTFKVFLSCLRYSTLSRLSAMCNFKIYKPQGNEKFNVSKLAICREIILKKKSKRHEIRSKQRRF